MDVGGVFIGAQGGILSIPPGRVRPGGGPVDKGQLLELVDGDGVHG